MKQTNIQVMNCIIDGGKIELEGATKYNILSVKSYIMEQVILNALPDYLIPKIKMAVRAINCGLRNFEVVERKVENCEIKIFIWDGKYLYNEYMEVI